jgi:hypothetical protein
LRSNPPFFGARIDELVFLTIRAGYRQLRPCDSLSSIIEIGFPWVHRTPTEKVTKKGKKKTVMVSLPVMELPCSLIDEAVGRQLRRTRKGGIMRPVIAQAQ